MKKWIPQPPKCTKCGKKKDGLNFCKACEKGITDMIMASTTATIKISWFKKKIIKLITKYHRIKNWFKRRRERKEEREEIDMLTNKSGYYSKGG